MATGILIRPGAVPQWKSIASISGKFLPVTIARKRLHTRPPQQTLAQDITSISGQSLEKPLSRSRSSRSSTAHLPFSDLIRSYLITVCTSSPLVIGLSIRILSAIVNSESILLSPDRNPIIRWLLKNTIYRQFCAGKNAAEVQSTIARLQQTGIKGIILCYAREIELRGDESSTATQHTKEALGNQEIESWAQGVLKTIRMVPEGNFVSIKFSGAGSQTLYHLKCSLPPPTLLSQYLHTICTLAHSRRIKICIDAEQSTIQAGIDTWTMNLQLQFNKPSQSSTASKPWACIYNTYQTYLVSTPETLTSHLSLASKENFILGIKLVRGAYLSSEPRHQFWPTKEETDTCFDTVARSLITKTPLPIPKPIPTSNPPQKSSSYPDISLILATHNLQSTRAALSLQRSISDKSTEVIYAQLQGMADHVTGELIIAATRAAAGGEIKTNTRYRKDLVKDVPLVCKYLTWGSVGECGKYLVRRAEENRDAACRTGDERKELGREVLRRLWA